MSTIDITFVEQGTFLKGTGRIADGWRAWKNGFAFFGRGAADYRGDRRISLDVDVKARPNSRSPLIEQFPVDLEASGESRFSLFAVRNGKLAVLFPIALALQGAQPRESMVLNDYGTEIRWPRKTAIWFELSMRFRIAAPPGRSAPVVREYDTQFWQGGLPSLGRRR
jgi:hypothetical protein